MYNNKKELKMNNLIKSFSVIIFSVFLINSCSNSGWSRADKTEFIDNCVIGASGGMTESQAKKYCKCVLDELMDDYDTPEDAAYADIYSYAFKCI
tara:strand:- start:3962 stop:4246 length:285 start_codon:yes stop_codon:yes gene_type:complete